MMMWTANAAAAGHAPAAFTPLKHMAHHPDPQSAGTKTPRGASAKPPHGTAASSHVSLQHGSFTRFPWLPLLSLVKEAPVYGFLTFGSFLFMVGGLYLPKMLKLKVGGLELEKASAGQVPAPSTLGISRSGSLTS